MIYQKLVGNLELGIGLEVDNPEVHIDFGVDKHPKQYTEFGVELGVCIVLKICIILKVCIVLEVSPQAVTDYLDVSP